MIIGDSGRVGRRNLLLAVAMPAVAAAQGTRGVWFDPTQLPSYTGRLDRMLVNPAGETDRLLFREGAQVVMPPSEAQDLGEAVRPGDSLIVWGIRARGAPVITMLAWAKAEGERPRFVSQPSWFAPTRRGSQRLQLAGVVDRTLLTPQGEGMGVLLVSGDVIRLSSAVHSALGDALKDGATIAAEGLGHRHGERISIDAERVGTEAGALRPLPEPPPAAQAGAASPAGGAAPPAARPAAGAAQP